MYKRIMHRAGIVDLGSNTARLVVYEFEPGKWFRLVEEIREPIRLNRGLHEGNTLDPAAIDRAVEALTLYSDYSRATNLDTLEVLATSALRDAGNRTQLLERVQELNLRISVLSGEEEAGLGVTAVANGFDFADAWVVDLGGGSVQASMMSSRSPAACSSFPLGGVRLADTFFAYDPPAEDEIDALDAEVDYHLGGLFERMRHDERPIVAMGGTVRNLARAIQKRARYPLDMLHGYFLHTEDLEELTERLLGMRSRKRARVPGIHPDRAEAAVAGARVFLRILRGAKRDGLWISGHGIREGAFHRQFTPAPHLLPDVRGFAVQNLFERHPQPRRHTQRVRKLAGRLFDGLRPIHGLGDVERELLDAAAVLHDIGKVVSHYAHEIHGAYLVRSDPLMGFSHGEQELIAQLVRYHRKGAPKVGPRRRLVDRGLSEAFLPLATCLRLAEKLERSRAGRVRDLEIEVRKRSVNVRLLADESPFIELWEVQKQAPLFERVFGKKLKLKGA